MKKNTILFAFIFCLYLVSRGQAFILPATSNDATQLSCECYQLTPNIQNQHGAVWNQNQVNLNNPFDYKFSIFLGSNNGNGADGIVFVIQNQSQQTPAVPGGGMGYAFFPGKSIGVEFDTYDNGAGLSDIPQDHIAVDTNGSLAGALAGPVPALPGGGNIDDGQWHTTEIIWNPGTNTLQVYFDGLLRVTTTFPGGLVNHIFGGQNMQYWGWTGADGGLSNVQQMCVFFQPNFASGINYSHCGPDTVSFQSTSTSGLNAIAGYQWDFGDGGTSNVQNPQHTFPGAGVYNVKLTIIDQSLCTKDTTFAVTIHPAPTLNTSQNNVSCFNGNDGKAKVVPGGGGSPYTYLWSPNSATTSSISSLTAGNYSVVVTDNFGCSNSATYTLTQPPVLTGSETHVNVLCHGNLTGAVTVTAGGGSPGYTYTWNPNVSGTNVANNIGAANYSITITDANNCTLLQTAAVSEPPLFTATEAHTDVQCSGQATGSVTITATGGTPGYTYNWNPNVSTGNSATNIPAATYSVTVTDANNCTIMQASTVSSPTPVVVTETQVNEICHGGANGSITLNTSGGVPAYTYTWNPNISTTGSATNIPAGTYSTTVTDANNCAFMQTNIITEPPAIVLTSDSVPVLCYGQSTGVIMLTAAGGMPAYNFFLSGGGVTLNSSTGQFNNLAPAAYSVGVTDQNGCSDSTTATVTSPPILTDVIAGAAPVCYHYTNGKVVVVAHGGTPGYTYTFSDGAVNTSGTISNLAAGTYAVTVTDNSLCTFNDFVTLIEPDSVLIDITPAVTQVKLGEALQLTSSTNQPGVVNYSWGPDFGLSCYDCANPVFNGVYSQAYNVVATNQDGCLGTTQFTVTVIPDYDIFFPNAFTPNADGINDLWQIFGNIGAIKQIEVMIFDRIGEKVFESNDINFKWDGTYKGVYAPPGAYLYTAKVVWLNNYSNNTFKGSLTLLR